MEVMLESDTQSRPPAMRIRLLNTASIELEYSFVRIVEGHL